MREDRYPFLRACRRQATEYTARLAHAAGGSVYEGVPGPPEEIFFPGDVQES